MIFHYHSGLDALEIRDPETGKPIGVIACATLRKAGWQADPITMCRMLPRTETKWAPAAPRGGQIHS